MRLQLACVHFELAALSVVTRRSVAALRVTTGMLTRSTRLSVRGDALRLDDFACRHYFTCRALLASVCSSHIIVEQ